MLSLMAAAFYVLVVIACTVASIVSRTHRQHPAHARSWLALALLFAVLIGLRVLNSEELARDGLREFLLDSDWYDDRRGIQGPLVMVVIAAGTLAGIFWLYRKLRAARGRRNLAVLAAQAAGLLMVALVALRTISFSALDKLLFGPLKLNWLTDLGSSIVVGGCALLYIVVVRRRARPSRGRAGR